MSSIPTKIINLEKRMDRRSHIEIEFLNRSEFEISFVKAVEDRIPAQGLYKTVKSIIEQAKKEKLPYVLICEDDHQFTLDYDDENFRNEIHYLETKGADVFLGGVSWFDFYTERRNSLYAINSFTGTQFMVIYSRFYDAILNVEFSANDTIDRWIAGLSENVFVSVPMISIQRDFGYSDATEKNNKVGQVAKLFADMTARWNALRQIDEHIYKTESLSLALENNSTSELLPTYIINLKSRTDRLKNVLSEFDGRSEFDIHVIKACEDKNGALGLWKSICKVVQKAKENEDEVILLCEDDHSFCSSYKKEKLISAIYQGAYLGADIILGGITNARQAIPVNDDLCWIDCFKCTQFTIIYSQFFDRILSMDFTDFDAADLVLSDMTANKYVIHPFISVQKDFGYSDIPLDCIDPKGRSLLFDECEVKIESLRKSLSKMKFKNTSSL